MSAEGAGSPMRIDVTPFEFPLLEALRCQPNRAAMWIEGGDPAKYHPEILVLYSQFFQICNTQGIEYRLECDSLLGYTRHGGVIPWEWDMDVGCTPENDRKLLAAGDQIEREDAVWGFHFYGDPDYQGRCYSKGFFPNFASSRDIQSTVFAQEVPGYTHCRFRFNALLRPQP